MMSKSFYMLLSSRVSSNIGDSIFYVVMMWYVFNNFGSEFWLGIAGVMFTLPSIIGFFWGPIIDKYSPKKIYIFISVIQFLLIFALILTHSFMNPSVYIILMFILLISITSELSYPIESVLIPRVVEKPSMYKANSMMSISNSTVDMLANGLSGIMLSILSIMVIFNINMILFLLPVIFMSYIKIKRSETQEEVSDSVTFNSSLKEGITFTFRRKILLLLLPLTVINFSLSITLVSLPVFADMLSGPEVYGFVLMAFGIGSVIGATLVSFVVKYLTFKVANVLCFTLAGVMWTVMVFGLNDSVILSLIFITASYIFIGIINVMYTTLFQMLPSERLLGRVNTIVESVISIAMPLGAFIGGILLTQYSVSHVMSVFGITLVIIGILFIFVLRKNDYDMNMLQDIE